MTYSWLNVFIDPKQTDSEQKNSECLGFKRSIASVNLISMVNALNLLVCVEHLTHANFDILARHLHAAHPTNKIT